MIQKQIKFKYDGKGTKLTWKEKKKERNLENRIIRVRKLDHLVNNVVHFSLFTIRPFFHKCIIPLNNPEESVSLVP